MSTATEQPGLPTVEQVRDHEQHGGLWRYVRPDGWPSFARLRTFFGELFVQWDSSVAYHNMPPGHEQQTWTPCDQQGNPLELVDEVKRRQMERDLASDRKNIAEQERDHLREVNEGLRERIRAMEVRIGGAESELLGLLGAPETPEGKALRALVRAAREGMQPPTFDASEGTLYDCLMEALDHNDLHILTGCAAALLGRREESTTLGDALNASWAAHKVEPGDSELECPCCGWVAAEGDMYDGDALLCGCAGIVSVDSETPAEVSMSDDPCPPSARCHRDAKPAKVETCVERRYFSDKYEWCMHPKCSSDYEPNGPDSAPPDDCPGPKPRE